MKNMERLFSRVLETAVKEMTVYVEKLGIEIFDGTPVNYKKLDCKRVVVARCSPTKNQTNSYADPFQTC